MSLRACVYKDCENYQIDKVSSGKFTLFQFPKDPVRRQKWMELGQAPKNLSPHAYLYCSDHFDRKFFAVNRRRTILVGEALPNPYVVEEKRKDDGQEEFIVDEGDNTYVLYHMKADELKDVERSPNEESEQDLQVESTMQEDEHGNVIQLLTNDFGVEDEIEIINEEEDSFETMKDDDNIIAKRKTIEDTTVYGSKSKLAKTANTSSESLEKYTNNSNRNMLTKHVNHASSTDERTVSLRVDVRNPDNADIKSDLLIDTNNITTFIFKGEEYVQMPKEYYINEKIELIRKLQRMERALKAIKNQIDGLDL